MLWKITIVEYFGMGGWVMIPLILLAFLLGVLISERLLYLGRLKKDNLSTDDLIDHLEGAAGEAKAIAGRGIRSELLRRFLQAKNLYGRLDEMIVTEITSGLLMDLKRNLRVIGSLTSVAPLLGLLGTVSGMITTFNVLTIFGTGNAKAMSGGISEALITTQFGLVIAIIGFFLSSVIQRWQRGCEQLVREITQHVVRKFEK